LQGVRPDGTSRLSQNFLTSALSGSGGKLSFAAERWYWRKPLTANPDIGVTP
jgi:hypothetical protein